MEGNDGGLPRSATSIVACSLPVACSFRLRTTPRFIRHRETFEASAASSSAPGDSRPLDPSPRWRLGEIPNNFREVGLCRQVSSWVKEKRIESLGENLFSPRLFFRFSTVRFAHRRPAWNAGRPGTVDCDKAPRRNLQLLRRQRCLFWFFLGLQERTPPSSYFLAIRSIYGDNAAFSGSLLGCKRERPRCCNFLQPSRIHASPA